MGDTQQDEPAPVIKISVSLSSGRVVELTIAVCRMQTAQAQGGSHKPNPSGRRVRRSAPTSIPPTPRSARPIHTTAALRRSAAPRSASAIKRLLSQCDRVHPCNQCKRYDKTCVFPEAENPRRGKKSVHTQSFPHSLFRLAPLPNPLLAQQAAFLNLPLLLHCQCCLGPSTNLHQIPRRSQGACSQARAPARRACPAGLARRPRWPALPQCRRQGRARPSPQAAARRQGCQRGRQRQCRLVPCLEVPGLPPAPDPSRSREAAARAQARVPPRQPDRRRRGAREAAQKGQRLRVERACERCRE